jgi:hypothetical protein
MKIAFLIFNHRSPEQLLRLLATLRRQLPDSPLVVHHDKFRAELSASALESLGNTHLLTSDKPIVWGDWSLVEAYWRSLTWISTNIEFDWLVVLSAQDYPIKPLAALGEYLASTGAGALVDAMPIGDLPTPGLRRITRRRFLYQYRPARELWPAARISERLWGSLRQSTALLADVLNNSQPYFKIYRYPDRMPWRFGHRASSTPFSPDWPCWFGSAWFGLSKGVVRYINAFVQNNPEYVAYYERTICPDESVTATIICNAPGIHVERTALHFVRWSRPQSGHPDILGIGDLPELSATPAFFARKFDLAIDSDILDRLDELSQ